MHGGDERPEWELLKVPVVAEIVAKLFRSGAVERGLRAAFADPQIVTPEMVQELYLPESSPENRMAQVSYSRRLDLDEVRSRVGETQTPTLSIFGEP